MAASKRPEKKCAACGALPDKYGNGLVALEPAGSGYEFAWLCAGRGRGGYDPKKPCLAKYLIEREVSCVVCGETDGMSYKAARRARPVCQTCESEIAAINARRQKRKWYAVDVYACFGWPLPMNTHADYHALGHALIDAIGDGGRVSGSEQLVTREKRTLSDASVDGCIELTEEQAAAFRLFVAKFDEMIARVAESQREAGGSLLLQLAGGEVSIEDYERLRLDPNERRRR